MIFFCDDMIDRFGLSIPIPEEQVSVLLNNTEEFLVDFIILTKNLGLHASDPSLAFNKKTNSHHKKAKKLKDDVIIITANREIKTGPLGNESGIAFGIQKRYYFANKDYGGGNSVVCHYEYLHMVFKVVIFPSGIYSGNKLSSTGVKDFILEWTPENER